MTELTPDPRSPSQAPVAPPSDGDHGGLAAVPAVLDLASPEGQRMATAFHEAGHAVMAFSLGRLIEKVTIAPGQLQTGGVRLGVCHLQKGRAKASTDRLEDDVLILLAGMVAEARFTGTYCRRGAAQDLRAVQRLLRSRTNNDRQSERLQRRMLDKAEHLLSDTGHVVAVESVARSLYQNTTLRGRAVRHLVDEARKSTS